MNSLTTWVLTNEESGQISGGRRQDRRYELSMDLRWKLIRRRKLLSEGIGRTIDLSSGGILIEADRPLPVGLNLELAINWPVALNNGAALQLAVAGKIVRSQGNLVAIRMIQHEFKTASESAKRAPVKGAAVRPPAQLVAGARETVSFGRLI